MDDCLSFYEGHAVRFNAYQAPLAPGAKEATNYFALPVETPACSRLSTTGPAIVTIDLMDRKLRETPVGLRIIAPATEGSPALLVDAPPQVYPRGVIEAHPTFHKPGQYQAILTYEDDAFPEHQMTLFVAETPSPIALRDVLGVLLIAAAGALATGEIKRLTHRRP